MLDSCRITKVDGYTVDPVTAVNTPNVVITYEGPCKIQSLRAYESTPTGGDRQWTVSPLELHLPVTGTADVGTDQRAEILTSVDPVNVGRVLRIRSGDRKSLQTALRLAVDEVID